MYLKKRHMKVQPLKILKPAHHRAARQAAQQLYARVRRRPTKVWQRES